MTTAGSPATFVTTPIVVNDDPVGAPVASLVEPAAALRLQFVAEALVVEPSGDRSTVYVLT